MLITGAGGFARELIDLLEDERGLSRKDFILFDNINTSNSDFYKDFKILRSFEEVKDYVLNGNKIKFTIGFGDVCGRKKVFEELVNIGCEPDNVISRKAWIGNIDVNIGIGVQILQNVVITTGVRIGKGTLVNLASILSHDVQIGDFCEIACGVKISGRCRIGNNVFIGTGARCFYR